MPIINTHCQQILYPYELEFSIYVQRVLFNRALFTTNTNSSNVLDPPISTKPYLHLSCLLQTHISSSLTSLIEHAC